MEKLGIELPLLITQVVNFTIMVAVLTKLLYQPVLKGLAARRKKIADSIKMAEEIEQEKEKLGKKREEMLTETREESRVILELAKKDGRKLKDELVAEGKIEISRLKTKMEKELAAKYAELTAKVVSHTVEIAAALTRRVMPKILDDSLHHKLITEELRRLEGKHGKT